MMQGNVSINVSRQTKMFKNYCTAVQWYPKGTCHFRKPMPRQYTGIKQ